MSPAVWVCVCVKRILTAGHLSEGLHGNFADIVNESCVLPIRMINSVANLGVIKPGESVTNPTDQILSQAASMQFGDSLLPHSADQRGAPGGGGMGDIRRCRKIARFP